MAHEKEEVVIPAPRPVVPDDALREAPLALELDSELDEDRLPEDEGPFLEPKVPAQVRRLAAEVIAGLDDRGTRLRIDGAEDPLTSVANTANGVIRTADGRRVRRGGGLRPTKRRARKVAQMNLWE